MIASCSAVADFVAVTYLEENTEWPPRSFAPRLSRPPLRSFVIVKEANVSVRRMQSARRLIRCNQISRTGFGGLIGVGHLICRDERCGEDGRCVRRTSGQRKTREHSRSSRGSEEKGGESRSSPTLLKVDELRAATKTAPRAILLNRIMVSSVQSGKIFMTERYVFVYEEGLMNGRRRRGERVEIERSRALR